MAERTPEGDWEMERCLQELRQIVDERDALKRENAELSAQLAEVRKDAVAADESMMAVYLAGSASSTESWREELAKAQARIAKLERELAKHIGHKGVAALEGCEEGGKNDA